MQAIMHRAIPAGYRDDVDRAVHILREGGCSEIFLFGSIPQGTAGDRSDIDIAVRGCPAERFFGLLGSLLMELRHPVDLIDLDEHSTFAERLVAEGKLFRVAGNV